MNTRTVEGSALIPITVYACAYVSPMSSSKNGSAETRKAHTNSMHWTNNNNNNTQLEGGSIGANVRHTLVFERKSSYPLMVSLHTAKYGATQGNSSVLDWIDCKCLQYFRLIVFISPHFNQFREMLWGRPLLTPIPCPNDKYVFEYNIAEGNREGDFDKYYSSNKRSVIWAPPSMTMPEKTWFLFSFVCVFCSLCRRFPACVA